jgi:diguanylate cyclase (GGDEF)-like protein
MKAAREDRGLISLKRYLDEFDQLQPVLEQLKENYVKSLEGSIGGMLPLDQGITQISRQLQELLEGLREQQAWTLPALVQLQTGVTDLQIRYAKDAAGVLAMRDQEIRGILHSLSEAAATLAAQAAEGDGGLAVVTSKLEELRNIDSLTELRQRLEQDVAELKVAATKLRSSHEGCLQQLKLELKIFQERWEESRTEAATDELTGLSNRRAGESAMRAIIQSGERLCILLLDLDKFKPVNDCFGHQVGDSVLRNFGKRLRAGVRTTDIVCRWGGDEFVVVLPDCTLKQAVERAGHLSESFGTPMEVDAGGRTISLEVKACIGVAEHKKGETLEVLLQRADERMYHLKGNQSEQR